MSGDERVSRRNLLRRLVGRVAWAVGGEMPSPEPTNVLAVPYVPYTVRPTGVGRKDEEESR